MAAPFTLAEAYPVHLGVDAIGDGVFQLHLDDFAGHSGGDELTLDLGRQLGAEFPTWSHFLAAFVEKQPSQDALVLFGKSLFQLITESVRIHDAWTGIADRAGQRPLTLTLELGPRTELFAALPFELLQDTTGFVFARPGSAVRRSYRELAQKSFAAPVEPRVLLATACPPYSGDVFDPAPHKVALEKVFGKRVEFLENATREGLREKLRAADADRDPFHYLHILAHGYRDIATAGICLEDEAGQRDFVDAQKLGQVLAGRELKLVFLCSCKTAVANATAFSGVGQQLLMPQGADLPCVVATQANLPVARSAELAEHFYRNLLAHPDPAAALVAARLQAYEVGGYGWSVPILLARPEPLAASGLAMVAGVPIRKATYLPRPELEDKILEALRRHRLVSVVGLPGIGKTEVGAEASRRAVTAGQFARAIYTEAIPNLTPSMLRLRLGLALGLKEPEADDELLALAFAAQRERLLLVIDNAEDLMASESSQLLFRDQLDSLLAGAPLLHILLTTRWRVGVTRESEFEIDVEPLPKRQMASLLEKELRAQGSYNETWPDRPEWDELLGLLDGHPRALWLIARQLSGRAASLEGVVARLKTLRADAVVDADLIGRADVFARLGDKKARLLSLVAGMDFSFEVLEARHPAAVEVFLALSLFPAGLPEVVAKVVAGEEGQLGLEQLNRFHLAQWQGSRVFYPVPLHWYAARRRAERELDEELYRHRALEGFVGFTNTCDEFLVGGNILASLEPFLRELPTLVMLVDGWKPINEAKTSLLSTLATAARNVLNFADQLAFARALFQKGLDEARQVVDRQGEANCLISLGDLQRRECELAAARASCLAALSISREIPDRLGEANSLQSLGDLDMRESELAEARARYLEAVAIYREIGGRLGEANCLNHLGDIQLLEVKLAEARASYQEALPIFRELRNLVGEVNCLQSLALLALAEGQTREAFTAFLATLSQFQALADRLGVQSCLAYLAEAADKYGDGDRALLLAEASLSLGREVGDRLGQTINLAFQVEVWLKRKDFGPAFAAMLSHRDLSIAIRDARGSARYLTWIEKFLPQLTPAVRQLLEENPEAVRAHGIAEAQKRFDESGLELFSPLP